jgi:hypothetical protein
MIRTRPHDPRSRHLLRLVYAFVFSSSCVERVRGSREKAAQQLTDIESGSEIGRNPWLCRFAQEVEIG